MRTVTIPSIALFLIATTLAHAAPADISQPSISMQPYPFTVTVGLVCANADELKKVLDAMASNADPPDAQCQVLDGSQPVAATATPVEVYKNAGIYGMITKYSAPSLPDVYGIMALQPAPASNTPAPSHSDVNA